MAKKVDPNTKAEAERAVRDIVAADNEKRPGRWFFRRDLYNRAKVESPDRDTLIASGLDGKEVWVKFERRTESWQVRIGVSLSLDGERWFRYHTGIEPTAPIIAFWEFLGLKASNRWRNEANFVYDQVHRMLNVGQD
jgi:hypothetical protein